MRTILWSTTCEEKIDHSTVTLTQTIKRIGHTRMEGGETRKTPDGTKNPIRRRDRVLAKRE